MRAAACALLVAASLAACGPGTAPGANEAAPAVQTATPVGLYEIRNAAGTSQLCLAGGEGAYRFGLLLHGANRSSCSGAGTATQTDAGLRLEMGGEGVCAFDARFVDGRLSFAAEVPPGCSYYCGEGSTLAGATFDKVGGTEADARRARDLVGDPLC